LDREQIKDMCDYMFPLTFPAGEFVIREGEAGSHLYVSSEGTLYVSQDSRNLGTLKPGVAFGELALLYNCKRTASVRGNLWKTEMPQNYQKVSNTIFFNLKFQIKSKLPPKNLLAFYSL
jgi:hypothetical protein